VSVIAGVVIDVVPESAVLAHKALQGRSGISRIEGPVATGRLVAVLEAANNRSMDGLLESILATDGIINISPAFIQFDAEEVAPHV
jgi:nitrate reductase NapAB chaperone NapD